MSNITSKSPETASAGLKKGANTAGRAINYGLKFLGNKLLLKGALLLAKLFLVLLKMLAPILIVVGIISVLGFFAHTARWSGVYDSVSCEKREKPQINRFEKGVWSPEDEEELWETYDKLATLPDDYTKCQIKQAEKYKLPKVLMAGLDWMLSEKIGITNVKKDGEWVNKDHSIIDPQPKLHYEYLQTKYKWSEPSEVILDIDMTVEIKTKEPVYKTKTIFYPEECPECERSQTALAESIGCITEFEEDETWLCIDLECDHEWLSLGDIESGNIGRLEIETNEVDYYEKEYHKEDLEETIIEEQILLKEADAFDGL